MVIQLTADLKEGIGILAELHSRSEVAEIAYALALHGEQYPNAVQALGYYVESNAAVIEKELQYRNTYCGTCKTIPCEVNAGNTCCHDRVRYGTCQHKTEEELAQEQADVLYQAEQAKEAQQLEAPLLARS